MNKSKRRHSAIATSISALAISILLFGPLTTAHAETFNLSFDSLPSNQGWTYEGAPLAEDAAFEADGFRLQQRTVASGENSVAGYTMAGIVDSKLEMSLTFYAAVSNYDGLSIASTGLGFNFLIRDDVSSFRLAMTDIAVIVNGQVHDLDTTAFHHYVLDMHPGGAFELFIDGVLAMTGQNSQLVGDNRLFFGDSADLENTDVAIEELSFTVSAAEPDIEVRKSVNNAFPMANEPVEFTVDVSNIGTGPAPNLLAVDQLPPEMTIPAGTAAFPSVGSYDPATGEWSIGDLDAGLGATLTVPALVTAAQPPDCIVNLASSDHPADTKTDNNEARVVIHQNGIESCIDLDVNFDISVGPEFMIFPECDSQSRYRGSVEVSNLALDAARNVTISIAQDPVVEPNLGFDDADCTNSPSSQCNIAEIAAGETVSISVTSGLFQSYESFEQTLSVSATSGDPDYDLANNNPVVVGTAGGFSSCVEFDLPTDVGFIGPACFIATAAYGSPLHAHIDALRDFRDRFMLTNRPGRTIVHFYYRYSPPLANYIAERDWLRAIARGLLAPIVYTIIYPAWAASLLFGLMLAAGFARFRLALLLCSVERSGMGGVPGTSCVQVFDELRSGRCRTAAQTRRGSGREY